MSRVEKATELVAKVAEILNELEMLGFDVQTPATFNATGVRTDTGTITVDRYADDERVAAITWDDVECRWVFQGPVEAVSRG